APEGSPSKAGGSNAAPQAPQATWAFLSDTHVDASLTAENQGQNMAANLLKVVAEVLQARPGTAIVNGDLARDAGRAGDYRSFLKLVEPLRQGGIPIHLTLGNHDDRENFVKVVLEGAPDAPFAAQESPVTQKYCSTLERDGVRWIL